MIYIKLVLMSMFWGGAFVAGKIAATEAGPLSVAFVRFSIASIFLLFLAKANDKSAPVTRKHLFGIVMLGLTGVAGYNALFFIGLTLIDASRAAIIIATCPAVIALSSVILGDRISLKKVAGVVVSLLGAVIVISKGNPLELLAGNIGTGEILLFICVLCWTAYSLIGRKMMKELSPLKLIAYSNVVGTIALLPPALMEGLLDGFGRYSFKSWFCIIYMALLATVTGCLWYYEGIKKIGPVKAGLFINLIPIWAIILSYFILHEAVTVSLLIGATLVVSGVYLTSRTPKEKSL